MALWDWSDTPRWSFVIDTDAYAGNFERALCAYVTGRHCGTGRVAAYLEMYQREVPEDFFESLHEQRVDDHGDDHIARAPMALAPTPGWGRRDDGNHYELEDGEEAPHPAYQSVAIFLSRQPTQEELQALAARAYAFPQLPREKPWDARPKILGCRVVEERTVLFSTPVVFDHA